MYLLFLWRVQWIFIVSLSELKGYLHIFLTRHPRDDYFIGLIYHWPSQVLCWEFMRTIGIWYYQLSCVTLEIQINDPYIPRPLGRHQWSSPCWWTCHQVWCGQPLSASHSSTGPSDETKLIRSMFAQEMSWI